MKTAFPYRYIPELPTFAYGCLLGLNIKVGTRQRQETLDEQPLSDKPRFTRCGETYKLTTGSSNIKAQHKVLCFRWGKDDFSVVKVKWFQMRFQG